MIPNYTTLVPAYGRDYKAKAALLADWAANRDFALASTGQLINREQVPPGTVLNFRYGGLRKVAVVKV